MLVWDAIISKEMTVKALSIISEVDYKYQKEDRQENTHFGASGVSLASLLDWPSITTCCERLLENIHRFYSNRLDVMLCKYYGKDLEY